LVRLNGGGTAVLVQRIFASSEMTLIVVSIAIGVRARNGSAWTLTLGE